MAKCLMQRSNLATKNCIGGSTDGRPDGTRELFILIAQAFAKERHAMTNDLKVPQQSTDLNDPATVKVVWAAMCAMVMEVHAPQDNLSADEWLLAAQILDQLNKAVNQDG